MAKRLFAFWQAELDHPKAALTADRLAKIEARIRELEPAFAKSGDPEDDPERIMRAAILGLASSSWHRGENPEGKIYDGIKVVFRDAEQLDKFFRLGADELLRREAADRVDGKHVVPATEPARHSTEAPKRYQRSGEQLEAFYEARRGPVAQTVEKLEKYIERYPDDDGARIELELAKNPVIIPDADRFEGLL